MSTDAAPAGGSRSRRLARTIVAIAAWALVAALAWVLWPTSLGGHTTLIIVSGQSMEPLYHGGDVVVARAGTPEVGDIVVYNPEGYGDAKVIHRIIGGDGESGWELQGDNNGFVDPFSPTNDAVLGIAALHLPKAGLFANAIANPWVWGSLLIAAAVLILWPSKDDENADEDDDDDDGSREASEPEGDPDVDDAPLTPAEQAVHAIIVAGARAVTDWRVGRPRRAIAISSAMIATLLASSAVLATPQRADAAQLGVTASAPATEIVQHCWPTSTSVTATPTGTATGGQYTQASIAGMPASCAGETMTIQLYSLSGTLIASATATASTTTFTVTPGTYSAASVAYAVVVIGVPRVISWTPPPAPASVTCVAINPGGNVAAQRTCTATVSPNGGTPWGDGNGGMLWNYTVNVTWDSTPASNWNWRVTIDHAQPPFPAFTPQFVGMYSNPGVVLAPGYACGQLPVLVLQSTSSTVWGASIEIGSGPPPSYFSGSVLCS